MYISITQSQAPGMGPAPGLPRMRLALLESGHEDLCGPVAAHPQARGARSPPESGHEDLCGPVAAHPQARVVSPPESGHEDLCGPVAAHPQVRTFATGDAAAGRCPYIVTGYNRMDSTSPRPTSAFITGTQTPHDTSHGAPKTACTTARHRRLVITSTTLQGRYASPTSSSSPSCPSPPCPRRAAPAC